MDSLYGNLFGFMLSGRVSQWDSLQAGTTSATLSKTGSTLHSTLISQLFIKTDSINSTVKIRYLPTGDTANSDLKYEFSMSSDNSLPIQFTYPIMVSSGSDLQIELTNCILDCSISANGFLLPDDITTLP